MSAAPIYFIPTSSKITGPGFLTNVPISFTIEAVNAVAPVTWWIPSPLPPGFSYDENTTGTVLTVSGTTNSPGTWNFVVQVRDSVQDPAYTIYSLIIDQNPENYISPRILNEADSLVPFNQQLTVHTIEGTPQTFDILSGNLPSGLSLVNIGDGIHANITGTPNVVETSTFTVRTLPKNIRQQFTMIVNPNNSLNLTPDALPNPVDNIFYSQTLTAVGGTPPYTLELDEDSTLPDGLRLNSTSPNTFTISGTPNREQTSTFILKLSDTVTTEKYQYELTVEHNPFNNLNITPSEIPNAMLNEFYSQPLTVSNSSGPITWAVTYGRLPEGLFLNSTSNNTAVISGVPSSSGTFLLEITAYDANGNYGEVFYIIVIEGDSDLVIWETHAGTLGTVPEGIFYTTKLLAHTQLWGEQVYYKLISGSLPKGFQCTKSGDLVGVATAVSRDITSKFVIRAYTTYISNGVEVVKSFADRTFTLTVADLNQPYFITPPGVIGVFYDGSVVSDLRIRFGNPNGDTTDTYVAVAAGSLPIKLKLSRDGLITGFINLLSLDQPFYQTYDFVVEVTDGRGSSLRTFSIGVFNTSRLTADNTLILADTTLFTADAAKNVYPIITVPEGNLGTYHSRAFFAFPFTGFNSFGYTMFWQDYAFSLVTAFGTTLVNGKQQPNVVIDRISGWVYGYLPEIYEPTKTFKFSIRNYYTYNGTNFFSKAFNYSITVTGDVLNTIVWTSNSELGSINNGGTSKFHVNAVSLDGYDLRYELTPDSYNSLPQGLQLLDNGLIAGRVSFNTFAIDGGTTIFDNDTTTFGSEYRFSVTAYYDVYNPSTGDFDRISSAKQFVIYVVRAFNSPYENLYIQAMPPLDDREIIAELLNNPDIFPADLIYRAEDPNFGVAKDVRYWHVYGLNSATRLQYLEAMQENHYWKSLLLGSIKTAVARDSNDNIIYEVVYSQVIDNLLNNEGESVSKEVVLPYVLNKTSVLPIYNIVGNGTTITISYPGPGSEVYPPPPLPFAVGQVVTLTNVDPPSYNGDYIVNTVNPTQITVNGSNTDAYIPISGTVSGANPNPVSTVFPNSLINMRDQIIATIGEQADILPDWMYSRQLDDSVLGFTPAWVIAYTKPGVSSKIAYNITEAIGDRLNLIDFDVDRYELDSQLSKNWIPGVVLDITNISGNGTVVTVSYTSQYDVPYHPDQIVTISGVLPTGYNGKFTVITSSVTTTTLAHTYTGSYISGGVIASDGNWTPDPPVYTTFDLDYHYQFINIMEIDGGYNYAPGDLLYIPAASVGAADDIIIQVNTVGGSGQISYVGAGTALWINPNGAQIQWQNNSSTIVNWLTSAQYSSVIGAFVLDAVAPTAQVGQQFFNIEAVTLTGSGTGAKFNFVVVPGKETTFDLNSMQFVEPVDEYESTNIYDKYLVFPHRTILG